MDDHKTALIVCEREPSPTLITALAGDGYDIVLSSSTLAALARKQAFDVAFVGPLATFAALELAAKELRSVAGKLVLLTNDMRASELGERLGAEIRVLAA